MTLPTRRLTLVVSLIALLGLSSSGLAKPLVPVEPESVGISSERISRIDSVFEEYVESGKLPGAVSLVIRKGEVAQLGVYGYRDVEGKMPMEEDTIFRIASQTKALTSVGIMILQEEGKLLISDPVSKYLPEYEKTTVAVPHPDLGYIVVPAKRQITIRDLLTHTSGVGYGWGIVEDEWKAAGIHGWYFADRDEPIRETVRRMAELPFESQPGEKFVYGYNTDILGALIEVASGQSLDEFLKDRLFDPLAMVDTHFYLPTDKADRLATVYAMREDGELKRSPDESAMEGQGGYVEGPRMSFSGGAGLLSTAHDYSRFLQMLLNEGEFEGKQILSRKSMELMSVNHLPKVAAFPWESGTGFGLGFRVVLDMGQKGELSSVGEYGWGGAYHSTYWIDPTEELVVVYFTQVIPADGLDDHAKLRALVYQALE
ncbi:serine hydrolase domain-containing protein [Pelagicoccus albus]|uniref:Beta-lactamase family protein n=1 Tax=Pelagicoccus albus TaxID=415222 RepID=A0A7X1EB87_9BACT|nr:serine hydrolase domain-containing protein [Pelagicoccus albus]MBC2607537.1 beta-lactamase family protein [Pelagicoccus albus]